MNAAEGTVQKFLKGLGRELTPHFHTTDFDCRCKRQDCTETLIDSVMVAGLEILVIKFPMLRIDSGHRCAAHNREVGGVPDSQHCLGKASDVSSLFVDPHEIYIAAERINCFENGGMGLYPTFCHLDNRGKKARWGLKTRGIKGDI